MDFTPVTLAEWRAQVEAELAGKSFDKVLVQQTLEGLPIAPLYTEGPPPGFPARDPAVPPFGVCLRHEAGATRASLLTDLDGGADALWLPLESVPDDLLARAFFIFDAVRSPLSALDRLATLSMSKARPVFALGWDPIGATVTKAVAAANLTAELASMGKVARRVGTEFPGATSVMVSTLPHHEAGADAVEEVACALSTGARYLGALLEAGLSPAEAIAQVAVQVAVGRDTFLELSKLRALRTCWGKLGAAIGAPSSAPAVGIHAVCSSRTLTIRDPWVNMLRVTTQTFAAVLGGADLVTPNTFDQAFGIVSPLGRRVARNTGLVLREESLLGKVGDPARGSYFFETVSDSLARAAWERFRSLEREGGIAVAIEGGGLAERFERSRRERVEQIAKRKMPILGVSEFANLDERLPAPVPAVGGVPGYRDAEGFEKLRVRAEEMQPRPEAVLVTLGSFADSRARATFAATFLAAGGIRSRETTADEAARIAVLCGTDAIYQTEAVTRARALKAAGCLRVLLAGRPGPLEAPLREAGVADFIFAGSDVLAVLSRLLEVPA